MIRKIKEWIFWNILHRKRIILKVKDEELRRAFKRLWEEADDATGN